MEHLIEQFVQERLQADPGGAIRAGEMHEAYLGWVMAQRSTLAPGEVVVAASHVVFGRTLASLGLPRRRDKHGHVYQGVRLL